MRAGADAGEDKAEHNDDGVMRLDEYGERLQMPTKLVGLRVACK